MHQVETARMYVSRRSQLPRNDAAYEHGLSNKRQNGNQPSTASSSSDHNRFVGRKCPHVRCNPLRPIKRFVVMAAFAQTAPFVCQLLDDFHPSGYDFCRRALEVSTDDVGKHGDGKNSAAKMRVCGRAAHA
jgi:hypothetical protein